MYICERSRLVLDQYQLQVVAAITQLRMNRIFHSATYDPDYRMAEDSIGKSIKCLVKKGKCRLS